MLWWSRPSIAALTRSGARNASEIAMLTLRTLQPSRLAMLSVVLRFTEPDPIWKWRRGAGMLSALFISFRVAGHASIRQCV